MDFIIKWCYSYTEGGSLREPVTFGPAHDLVVKAARVHMTECEVAVLAPVS